MESDDLDHMLLLSSMSFFIILRTSMTSWKAMWLCVHTCVCALVRAYRV